MKKLAALAIILATELVLPYAWSAPVAQQDKEGNQAALKSAVADIQKSLPAMKPWQKTLFEEEVLSLYSKFIRDYRLTSQGPSVEVDREAIQNYLGFYAPEIFFRAAPKIFVVLRPEKNCAKCMEALPDVRSMVQQRLERRGFSATFAQDGFDGVEYGKPLESHVLEMAKKEESPSSLLIQWRVTPAEELDSAHAGELHFQIKADLVLRKSTEVRRTGNLNLLSRDAFEPAASNLLVDLFTSIGSRSVLASLGGSETEEELLLEVSGIKEFAQFSQFKSDLALTLKEVGEIEERKLKRGQVTFALKTSRTPEEIRRILLGQQSVLTLTRVGGVEERVIRMEVR